ncbi:hypothetical protein AC579_9098 [Pseudocercospora musae]|uniref:Uncharacterized protein n=1 Tax=Pseudocercospora musae TaxID=113226 RepID=A0A139IIG8_9PEZI|nr:hypothetical protein AC579_9098 [Pseudocercospora musae]
MASNSEIREAAPFRADKQDPQNESRDLRNEKQHLEDELHNAQFLLRQAKEALRKKSEDHIKLLRSSVAVLHEIDHQQLSARVSRAVWQLSEDIVATGGEATGDLKTQIEVIDCTLPQK